MKINLLILLVFCAPFLLPAQNPVPNPGFENWTAGNPDDWTTNNFGPGASPILQASPGNSGSSALRGEVIAVGPTSFFPIVSSTNSSAAGFTVNQYYAALTFYYKTNIAASTTTFNAYVEMLDLFDTPMGGGFMPFNGIVSAYTLATIPITYFGPGPPSSAVIAFIINDSTAVPNIGEYFIVDDVELTGTVGLEEMRATVLSIEKVQPNPASGLASVYFSLPSNSNISFDLLDVTGRVCRQLVLNNEIAGRHKVEMDVAGIPSGVYILRMTAGQERRMASLQVVH